MEIGNRVFHNWNKEGEGSMTVVTAIKRSCNTWFYRAALDSGADYLSNMALRLGFGERTGIPLKAEGAGFVQTNAWSLQNLGQKTQSGDLANMAIGQGRVLVTPLAGLPVHGGSGGRGAHSAAAAGFAGAGHRGPGGDGLRAEGPQTHRPEP
jgi:cell division protein FtsI/penicillin-binding protein 2